jgi:hypothetical protein
MAKIKVNANGITDGTITATNIADGTITSGKILDGTIANADIANSTINLTTKVTGSLPVANGGTGLTALGSSLQVLRTNTGATALEFATLSSGFTLGTPVATTSGTSFDFTGIPSTAKLIAVNLHEVSLSGGDNLLVQIGDSGGISATGYLSTSAYAGASSSYTSDTGGFAIVSSSATAVFSGLCFISLVDSSTNTWVSSHTGKHATNYVIWGGGSKSLSSTLTQVRLTKTGANTFDAGKVNIMYI